MSPLVRRGALLLLTVLACVLPIGSAQAAPSTDNIATATTQADGSRVFDFAWDLDRQRGGEIGHLNKAVAGANCVECKATAIAFQVVLAHGRVNPVVPVNIAEAVNYECTGCTSSALAYQFVRVVPEPVKLTEEGRSILSDVRNQLRALEGRDLPVADLYTAVSAQAGRVEAVLRDEVVLKSDPGAEAAVLKQRTLRAADAG